MISIIEISSALSVKAKFTFFISTVSVDKVLKVSKLLIRNHLPENGNLPKGAINQNQRLYSAHRGLSLCVALFSY